MTTTISSIIAEPDSISKIFISTFNDYRAFLRAETTVVQLNDSDLRKWQRMADPYHENSYELLNLEVVTSTPDTTFINARLDTSLNHLAYSVDTFQFAIEYTDNLPDVHTSSEATLDKSTNIQTGQDTSITTRVMEIEVVPDTDEYRPLHSVFMSKLPLTPYSNAKETITIQGVDLDSLGNVVIRGLTVTHPDVTILYMKFGWDNVFSQVLPEEPWALKLNTPVDFVTSINIHQPSVNDGTVFDSMFDTYGGTALAKVHIPGNFFEVGGISVSDLKAVKYTFMYKSNTETPVRPTIYYKQPVYPDHEEYVSSTELKKNEGPKKNVGYNLKHRLRHILNVDDEIELKKTAENQKLYEDRESWNVFVNSNESNSTFTLGEGHELYFASVGEDISESTTYAEVVTAIMGTSDAYSQYTRVRSNDDWFDLHDRWREEIKSGTSGIRIKEKKFETYTANTILYGCNDQVKGSKAVGIHQLETALMHWPPNPVSETTNNLYDILLRHNALNGLARSESDLISPNATTSGVILFGGGDRVLKTNVTKAYFEHAFEGYDYSVQNPSLKDRFQNIDSQAAQIVFAENGRLNKAVVSKTQLENAFHGYGSSTTSIHNLESSLQDVQSRLNSDGLQSEYGSHTGSPPALVSWDGSAMTLGSPGGIITMNTVRKGLPTYSTNRKDTTTVSVSMTAPSQIESSLIYKNYDHNVGDHNLIWNVVKGPHARSKFKQLVSFLRRQFSDGIAGIDDAMNEYKIDKVVYVDNMHWKAPTLRSYTDTYTGHTNSDYNISTYGNAIQNPDEDVVYSNSGSVTDFVLPVDESEFYIAIWGRGPYWTCEELEVTSDNAEILPCDFSTGSSVLLLRKIRLLKEDNGDWMSGNINLSLHIGLNTSVRSTILLKEVQRDISEAEESRRLQASQAWTDAGVPPDMQPHITAQNKEPMAWVFDRLKKLSILTKTHLLADLGGFNGGNFENLKDKMANMVAAEGAAPWYDGYKAFRFDGPTDDLVGVHFLYHSTAYDSSHHLYKDVPNDATGYNRNRRVLLGEGGMFDFSGTWTAPLFSGGVQYSNVGDLLDIFENDWY